MLLIPYDHVTLHAICLIILMLIGNNILAWAYSIMVQSENNRIS